MNEKVRKAFRAGIKLGEILVVWLLDLADLVAGSEGLGKKLWR